MDNLKYYTTLTLVVLGLFAVIYPIMYWVAGLAVQHTLGGF